MQKTFRQDFISRKTIKNAGQLPMYLIENHHEGIVDRDKFNKVQTEMARRRNKPSSWIFTNCPGAVMAEVSPDSTIL